jgi:hypothetical protein
MENIEKIKEQTQGLKNLTFANRSLNMIMWDNLLEYKLRDFERKLTPKQIEAVCLDTSSRERKAGIRDYETRITDFDKLPESFKDGLKQAINNGDRSFVYYRNILFGDYTLSDFLYENIEMRKNFMANLDLLCEKSSELKEDLATTFAEIEQERKVEQQSHLEAMEKSQE